MSIPAQIPKHRLCLFLCGFGRHFNLSH